MRAFGSCHHKGGVQLAGYCRSPVALAWCFLLARRGLPSLAQSAGKPIKPSFGRLALRVSSLGVIMSIYFGGSRNLKSSPLMWQVVQSVIESGQYIHVGCQFGADEIAINAALMAEHGAPFLTVFAVAQSWRNAPEHVRFALNCEASVIFNAGGSSAPMPARYLLRSIAALQSCESAVFFAPGSGSLAVARECVRSGLPVFAFGEMPAPVPSVGGQWVAAQFFGFQCWQWSPAQLNLF